MLELSHRQELRPLAQLVADVQRACPDIEPLLVGALARDVLLHFAHGIRIERGTTDVDFAIVVADWPAFAEVRRALIASGRFEASTSAMHVLTHPAYGRVDLIPFGPLESSDASIAWPPTGEEVLSVLAYAEAKATAVPVLLPGSQRVLVVSLPMQAVLKVLAWKDRRYRKPRSDAADLSFILRTYPGAGNTDRLYELYPPTENFDLDQAGAWLLGHDAREQLQRHSKRFSNVIEALDKVLVPELDLQGSLSLAADMGGIDLDIAHGRLAAFHRGLHGEGH